MFCNECGSQVPDGAKFCHQCGKPSATSTAVTGTSSGAAQAVQMSPEPRVAVSPSTSIHKKTSNSTRSLFVLILLGVLGWLIYSVAHQNDTQIRPAPFVAPRPVVQPVTASLGQKAFTIGAGSYYYVKFTIPPRSTDVQMEGRFQATGGSGNDVEVIVLNEDEFTNWQNRHSVQTFYNSGRMTVGEVDAHLPSTGTSDSTTYYLIFNNAFSVFSNKAVSTDITLHYNRTI